MINPRNMTMVILQSSTFNKTLQWKDNGHVVDITGMEIAFQVRQRGDNDVLLLSASTTTGDIEIVDGENGLFKFNIPASVTESLDFNNALYDILIKDIDGSVHRISQGIVLLDISQTKLEAFE